MNHFLQLVYPLISIISRTISVFSSKMSPLKSINGTQIMFTSILQVDAIQIFPTAIAFPYLHIFIQQNMSICLSLNEPQQFFNHSPHKDLFSCQQWEGILQLKSHCLSKYRLSSHPSSVIL